MFSHHIKRYPEETVQRVRKLRNKGCSHREIGKIISIPFPTIRRWYLGIKKGKRRSLNETERNESIRKRIIEQGKEIVTKLKVDRTSKTKAKLLAKDIGKITSELVL